MRKVLLLFFLMALCSLPSKAGDKLKTNYRTALVLAYSPANNVYEDDNLKLEIYNEKLWVTNKTNKTIFFDLSQCFLVHNGTSYPMWSEHKDEKNASKANHFKDDEFIAIAPSTGSKQNETFVCNLAGGVYGKYTTTESPMGDFTEYEERLLTMINELVNESLSEDPKGKEYLGTATRHLTEDESINNIGANIAYAFNKKSEDWTPVMISTWVSDVCLAPYYVDMPAELDKKEKRGFGVKKAEAAKVIVKAESPFEFESDKSPVIVCDWTGNFKKGEFKLNPTWVSKKKGMGFGQILFASFATVATGGLGAVLFANNEETFYKKEIQFVGQDSDWGKMSYLPVNDLTRFNNKR